MFHRHPDPRHRPHHRDPRRGPGPDRDPRSGFGPRPGSGPDGLPGGIREMLGGRGRGMVRRGEIRPLVLAVLAARPMHGYEVITELEARSGGRWRPSAGSVYPTLQQLSDEGLVTSEEIEGRRTYSLTDAGRAAVDATPAPSPWGRGRHGDSEIKPLAMQVVAAAIQVERAGSAAARTETARILGEARRAIYRLLAEDDAAPAPDAVPDAVPAPDATLDPDEA